jgi:hypothetical protein
MLVLASGCPPMVKKRFVIKFKSHGRKPLSQIATRQDNCAPDSAMCDTFKSEIDYVASPNARFVWSETLLFMDQIILLCTITIGPYQYLF